MNNLLKVLLLTLMCVSAAAAQSKKYDYFVIDWNSMSWIYRFNCETGAFQYVPDKQKNWLPGQMNPGVHLPTAATVEHGRFRLEKSGNRLLLVDTVDDQGYYSEDVQSPGSTPKAPRIFYLFP